MKFIQTKDHQVSGTYNHTGLDAQKKVAEFRLTACLNKFNVIVWNTTGVTERVTDRVLAKLQATHSWSADF